MKKIPFYFFLLFYVIGYDTAMCQHAVVQADYPNTVERTIIREYNFPATVSYVESSIEHYFAYADATTLRIQGYYLKDPDGWINYQRSEAEPSF